MKRNKAPAVNSDLAKASSKPPALVPAKSAAAPSNASAAKNASGTLPSKLSSSARSRSALRPKSQSPRSSVKSAVPSSLTSPAGRSPTRASKRMGIMSRRRNDRLGALPFASGAAAPFSLDAALKGTIPSYSGSLRGSSRSSSNGADILPTPGSKRAWFFDIHEDTPEQEMTNLLQHSTCTLDISSDEESESRARRDRAEGRDKENIPPADDISQTSPRPANTAANVDEMPIEKQRSPLAEMNVADYYGDGCDSTSTIIVPGDEEDVDEEAVEAPAPAATRPSRSPRGEHDKSALDQPQVSLADVEAVNVDDIMGANHRPSKAAVSKPLEGASESFELWESSSVKDEGEAPAS